MHLFGILKIGWFLAKKGFWQAGVILLGLVWLPQMVATFYSEYLLKDLSLQLFYQLERASDQALAAGFFNELVQTFYQAGAPVILLEVFLFVLAFVAYQGCVHLFLTLARAHSAPGVLYLVGQGVRDLPFLVLPALFLLLIGFTFSQGVIMLGAAVACLALMIPVLVADGLRSPFRIFGTSMFVKYARRPGQANAAQNFGPWRAFVIMLSLGGMFFSLQVLTASAQGGFLEIYRYLAQPEQWAASFIPQTFLSTASTLILWNSAASNLVFVLSLIFAATTTTAVYQVATNHIEPQVV